jgi:predicted transcriptional regulator
MEEGLPTILWKLSRDIVNVVKTLKENGKIRRIKRLWFREKITNFEYKEGSMGWQASPEYFEKEEWDWRDRFRIIEPEIKKLLTYINATFADYNIAYTLARKVFRPTILGLPEGVLRIYDVCKKLDKESMEITSKTVTENCDYSQKTVQKYLNELVRARLLLRDESQREYRYSLIEAEDDRLKLNLQLIERFEEKELNNWVSSIVDKEKGYGVSYDEMKANVYDPLPSIYESTILNKAKNCSSESEKAKEGRFYQNLQSLSELKNTLRKLARLFGGLIPIQDAIREFKAKGIEDPELLIKKLLQQGKLYEPKNGFLNVLGD